MNKKLRIAVLILLILILFPLKNVSAATYHTYKVYLGDDYKAKGYPGFVSLASNKNDLYYNISSKQNHILVIVFMPVKQLIGKMMV